MLNTEQRYNNAEQNALLILNNQNNALFIEFPNNSNCYICNVMIFFATFIKPQQFEQLQ